MPICEGVYSFAGATSVEGGVSDVHLDAQPSDLEERVPATRTNARIHEIDAVILGFGVVFPRRRHTRTDPEKTRTQTRGENSQSRGEKQRRENPDQG